MAVYQNKSGRWYYRFKIDGQQYHKSIPEATCRRDAEKAEARVKSDLFQGKYNLIESKGKQKFEELVNAYNEYAETNKRSWKNERWLIKRFLSFFGGKRLKDITPIMIERYRSERKKKGKKDGSPLRGATINRELEILRKMFSMAIDNNWLDSSPCSAKKVKPLQEDNILERYLEKDEEVRLLSYCIGVYEYMRPIFICALHTGMRKSEILNLQWNCVDFKKRYIALLKTKSGKTRKIPISYTLLEELKKLKEKSSSEYVFANPETGQPYYDIRRPFKELLDKANIKGFRFHDLRHTAATRMVASGVDLVVVQDILGHEDLKTTTRYAHPVPEHKIRAIEALDSYNDLLDKPLKKHA